MRSISNNFRKFDLKRIRPETWLILIILFALFLRLYFFVGLNLNDDLCYVNSAYDITEGKFIFNKWIFAPRLMMHYPIALLFTIFGVSNFSASLYILLCSLGSVIITYYIGKILFNEKVGLISAFLMSFFPLEVSYATTIVPDVSVAFFMALSVCLFLLGEKKNKNIFYILGGIAIGLAWLVKSLAMLIFLFFLTYFILDKIFNFKSLISGKPFKKSASLNILKIRKAFLLLLTGFLIVIFLEGSLYFFTNNDFLLRFHAETEHYVPSLLGVNTNLDYYPRVLFNQNSPYFNFFGYFFYFAILSILFILFDKFQKNRKTIILLAWLIPILIYMQYGTMNPFQYVFMQRIYRFLTVVTIPTSLIIGYFLIENKFDTKKIVLITITCFLLFTSLFYMSKTTFYINYGMLDYKITAEYLKKYPDKNIYADPDTIGKLNFLLAYKRTENLKNIINVKDPNEIRDSFVVVDASRGYVELPNLKYTLPQFLWNPPKHWEEVKVITESDFEYYGRYDTKIYYIP